jgi:uncharacterized protein
MLHRHDPLEGIDPDGHITTGARHAHIAPAFRPVLDAARERLTHLSGTASLYVYGSVATGMARPGPSDVDLVTIGLDAAVAAQLAADLSASFRGLCRSVEVGAAQAADHAGDDDEAHGNRVFLRHYCVHLAGPDPARTLPAYPADRAAARGFNGDIGLRASGWRLALDRSDPHVLGRRLARKTLFAVTGLVSLHDHTWTTDRHAAARRWGELTPALAPALARLQAWSEGEPPAPTTAELHEALEGVVAAVAEAFRDRIGWWGGVTGR